VGGTDSGLAKRGEDREKKSAIEVQSWHTAEEKTGIVQEAGRKNVEVLMNYSQAFKTQTFLRRGFGGERQEVERQTKLKVKKGRS